MTLGTAKGVLRNSTSSTCIYYGRATFANVPRTLLTVAQELRCAVLVSYLRLASALEAIPALAGWGLGRWTPYD